MGEIFTATYAGKFRRTVHQDEAGQYLGRMEACIEGDWIPIGVAVALSDREEALAWLSRVSHAGRKESR